jgi:hypothetical protein
VVAIRLALFGSGVDTRSAQTDCYNSVTSPEVTALVAETRAAMEAVTSYRLHVTGEYGMDGSLSTSNGWRDVRVDLVSGRSYGTWSRYEGAAWESYNDGVTYYDKGVGGQWRASSEEDAPEPTWECEAASEEVVSDGKADGVIHLRMIQRSVDKRYSDRVVDVYIRADDNLPIKTVSTWQYPLGGDRYQPLSFTQVCEYSEFNVPVVFPDDLPGNVPRY